MKIDKHTSTPILKLTGRIIDVESKKLKKKFESIYKKKYSRIVIDISFTEFIDSHGLGVIVYYHTLLQKAGRELILLNRNTNPQAYMPRLLELTRLNMVFRIVSHLNNINN